MIRENRDPVFWNRIANDPSVRPQVGAGTEALDLTDQLSRSLAFADDHGGFIFEPHEIGRYELHTLILPEGRGRAVLPAFAIAARLLFAATDCTEIVTKTAGSNRAAAIMARRAGFRPIFTRKAAWHDGTDLTFYSLSLDDWMTRDETLPAEGHAFHEMIEAAKHEAGSELPIHPDDDAHDRAAGAAVLMMLAGQAAKAAWIYSRWACLAGYQTIELINDDPPVLDVRDALVTVKAGRLEVLECR